jgi:hypothetical protein
MKNRIEGSASPEPSEPKEFYGHDNKRIDAGSKKENRRGVQSMKERLTNDVR